MLAGLDATPQLSASQLHELVWQAASAQWSTSHFQRGRAGRGEGRELHAAEQA